MNSKIVIKRVEVPHNKWKLLTKPEWYPFIQEKMLEKGFDLKKKINIHENLEKMVMVYEQKKYIIPKRKRYEET